MKHDGKISFDEVRRVLDYDQHTGCLFWKVRLSDRLRVGQLAGRTHSTNGRREIRIHGVRYQAHRIIWLWMTGFWPKNEIDHKDGTPQTTAGLT